MLEEQLKAAAAAGDIGSLLKLMSKTSELTPADFVKKTLGNVLFIYYTYLNYFHLRPNSMEDLVDGLLFIEARNFLDKKAYSEAKARAESTRPSGRGLYG